MKRTHAMGGLAILLACLVGGAAGLVFGQPYQETPASGPVATPSARPDQGPPIVPAPTRIDNPYPVPPSLPATQTVPMVVRGRSVAPGKYAKAMAGEG